MFCQSGLALVVAFGLASCSAPSELQLAHASTDDTGAQYLVVDCVLPPQMIRQGEASVRFTPSRSAKLSSRLCAQQGGAQRAGIEAWQRLAEAGNTEAQTYLGEMYEAGTGGVAQNTAKALEWYTRAARAKPGNARAISNLALVYSNGAVGLAPEPAKAAALVKEPMAATGLDTRQIIVVSTATTTTTAPPEAPLDNTLKPFAFGQYHALLIGNSNYAHLPQLNSPVHEVDVIANTLSSRYGFRITKLKNATRNQILKQLDDLNETLQETDNLLVYYSGHGAESESREGFWIPVDGEAPGSPSRLRTRLWVSSSELRQKLAEMAPRHVLVVSDSCYSARFLQFRGMLNAADMGPSNAYLQNFAKLYAAKSRTALTSGGLAPVLEPNDGSNLSVFAKAFIQFLEKNRNAMPSVHVFSGIESNVVAASSQLGFAQQPQWGPITGSGHESGDFWFNPK
jgi:hypothetical protein